MQTCLMNHVDKINVKRPIFRHQLKSINFSEAPDHKLNTLEYQNFTSYICNYIVTLKEKIIPYFYDFFQSSVYISSRFCFLVGICSRTSST